MAASPPMEPPTAPPMTPALEDFFCSVAGDVEVGVGADVLDAVSELPVFLEDADDEDVDVAMVVGVEVVLVLVCFGATLIVVITVGVPITTSQPRLAPLEPKQNQTIPHQSHIPIHTRKEHHSILITTRILRLLQRNIRRIDAPIQILLRIRTLGHALSATDIVLVGRPAKRRARGAPVRLVGAAAADELGRAGLLELVARGLADAVGEARVARAAAD